MGAVRRAVGRLALPLFVPVCAAGLLVLAWSLLPPARHDPPPPDPNRPARVMPPPPIPAAEFEPLRNVARALANVRPGMPRADVEAAVGRPDAKHVGPVEPDRKVFKTRYPAYVSDPLWFAPDVRGFCDAVLEYDASRPGHPLVRLFCEPTAPPAGAAQAGVATPRVPM